MIDKEKLEAALSNSIFVQNGCRPIIDSAQAYLNLLKAIDEKRLAVVPCEVEDKMVQVFAYERHQLFDAPYPKVKRSMKAAILVVDQKQILKELEG